MFSSASPARAYPVAGGGQYYTARGLGDVWGFVAGSALLLDYTIDVALFAAASAGYVTYFIPAIREYAMDLGPFHRINPGAAETVILILFMIWLNIRGVRESTLFNEFLGSLDMITESLVIICGFLFAWKPDLTPRALDTLGNMYAFGATLAYLLVFVSLVRLRLTDPITPRPYRVPLDITWRRGDERVQIPVLGFLRIAGVSLIFFEVIYTHAIGRIAGPAWVLLCLGYYVWFRRRAGYPVWRSLPRDWTAEQVAILKSAEEFDLLEEYEFALAAQEKARAKRTPPSPGPQDRSRRP